MFERIKSRLAIRKLDWGQALERGWKLLKAGKAKESVLYFRQSMRVNPGEYGTASGYDSAEKGLVQALTMLGRMDEAEKLLRPPSRFDELIEAVRAAGLIVSLVIAPIALLWFAAPHIIALFPAEPVHGAVVTMKRGESIRIDVRFLRDFDIAAKGAIILPAGKGETPGAWEECEYRGAGIVATKEGRLQGHISLLPGRSEGLMWAIGAPDFMGKTGGAKIYLQAGSGIPPGEYGIWLAGAYLEHERRKSATRMHSADPAEQVWVADPFWPNETIPYDRVETPVVRVTVE